MPEPLHQAPEAAPNLIEDQSPLAPFRQPVFRMLWITWLMANICTWMSDVAAAWTMTSLNASPLWVALVQTAASLPVFLLGIPSGALADILDRKRYFLFTQIWVAGVACLLSLVVFLDILTPGLLLLLIFANGVGLAMRWPVFSAIVPELVPRIQLPAALALNGVSMNASRIIGPLLAGAAWITTANSLSVSAQMGLPDWVRARGMSTYQMAIMGSNAIGAAVWGQVATMASVRVSVVLGALTGITAMAVVNRLMPAQGMVEDLTPSSLLKAPQTDEPPANGHVLLMIEDLIDPDRADEFRDLMQESRRSRLRHGVLQWELLHDINQPGRFIEMIEDESWTSHQRRFDRVTTADVALRDRKLAFHIGESPPLVTRSVMETTIKR